MKWMLFDAAVPTVYDRGNFDYLPLILSIVLIIVIASAIVLVLLHKKKKK